MKSKFIFIFVCALSISMGIVSIGNSQTYAEGIYLPLISSGDDDPPVIIKTPTPTSTPTPTPSPTATPTTTPTTTATCSYDAYNCPDFPTQCAAQAVFDYCMAEVQYDVHGLDRDNDGIACETLPSCASSQ